MKKNVLNYGSDIQALQDAIKLTNQRVRELEQENQKLKKQLQKLKTTNAKQRQRMRSQAGSLKAAKARVQKLRTQLSKARKVIRAAAPKVKSVTHRTRAEYLEQIKPQFIERFIKRLHETYSDFKQEWDATIRQALSGLSYDEIDGIMRMLNLDSMYYESNGYRPNTGATGEMIYGYFVQFIPQGAA